MRRRVWKRTKRFFVYGCLRIVAFFLLLIPLRLGLFWGRLFGTLAFYVAHEPRQRAVSQLMNALNVEKEAARKTALLVFKNIGMVIVEIACLGRIRRRFQEYVEFTDEDIALLRGALKKGRGVIFVASHLGNWELMAQRVMHEGFEGATLARRASNRYLGDWLVRKRLEGGLETINRKDPSASRRMLSALRGGRLLGVLIDQDTRVSSVHVPFFGRPASTPSAAAELALRKEAPIVLGTIGRKQKTGHRLRLTLVSWTPSKNESKPERVRALTAHMTKLIERDIRKNPSEWVWFHNRWKT